jgi:hypothetical protein
MRVFTEAQRFTQWWLSVILIATFAIVLVTSYNTYQEIAKDSNAVLSLIASNIITPLVILLIYGLKLKTKINEQGVFYGFWPFHLKMKNIAWSQIEKIYVREYNPILEYGGWGYKFSFNKRGKAYTTKGNIGIQIEFKDGKKMLLGTQKRVEAESVINSYKYI